MKETDVTEDSRFDSVQKSLARTLLLIANVGPDGISERTTIEVSRQTLAERIGSTRAQVGDCMRAFKKMAYIDYVGDSIEVRKSLLAVILAA